MAENWRLIDTGLRSAAQNIALSRALLESHRAEKDASHRRGFGHYLHHYAWRRFLFQILVRPFLRVARQKRSW